MFEQTGTAVRMVFESSTVDVEKEEPAYDIETFVADLGGVLGLFVGFNFLYGLGLCLSAKNKITELIYIFLSKI